MAALIAAPGKPCVLLLLPLLLANCLVCTTIANLHRPIFSKTAGTYSPQSIERTVLHTIAHSADKHDATVKSLQSSNGSVLDTNPGNPQNRGHPHSVLAPQNRTRRRGTFYTLTSQKGTRNPINDVTRRGYGLFSSEQPCQNDSRTRLPAYNTSLLRHSSLCTLYYDTGQFTLSGFTDTSMDTVEAMLPQGNILPDISEWDAAAAEKKYVEISRAIAAAGKGRLVVGAGGYPVNSNRVVKQEVESGRDSMYNGALHGIPYGTTSEAVAAFGERRITATGLAATSGKNQAGVVKGFLSKTTAARATSQLVQNVQPDAVSVVSDNMAYFRAPTKEVPGYYEVHLHPGPGKKLSLAAALQTGGEGKVLPVLDPVSKTPALGVPGLRFPQFMQSVPGSQMVKVSFECRPLHSKGWNGGFQLMNTYTLPEIQHIADLAGWALHDLAVLVMQHLSGPMQHIYLDRVAEMAATPYRRERCIRALVLQSPVMRLLDIVQIAPVQGGPGALMLSFGNQASAEAFKATGGIKAMVPGRYEMSLAYQLPLTRPADMSTGVDLVGIRQYPDQAGLREMAAGLVSIFREGEQNMKIVAGPAVQKVNTNLVLLTVDGGSYEVPDQAEGLDINRFQACLFPHIGDTRLARDLTTSTRQLNKSGAVTIYIKDRVRAMRFFTGAKPLNLGASQVQVRTHSLGPLGASSFLKESGWEASRVVLALRPAQPIPVSKVPYPGNGAISGEAMLMKMAEAATMALTTAPAAADDPQQPAAPEIGAGVPQSGMAWLLAQAARMVGSIYTCVSMQRLNCLYLCAWMHNTHEDSLNNHHAHYPYHDTVNAVHTLDTNAGPLTGVACSTLLHHPLHLHLLPEHMQTLSQMLHLEQLQVRLTTAVSAPGFRQTWQQPTVPRLLSMWPLPLPSTWVCRRSSWTMRCPSLVMTRAPEGSSLAY